MIGYTIEIKGEAGQTKIILDYIYVVLPVGTLPTRIETSDYYS